MYEKESEDSKYHTDPYRAVNFKIDEEGNPVCPGGKRFRYLKTVPVRGNKYGRTEEYYQCEDCAGCPHKERCCKATGNRTIRLNQELTVFHKEVLENLNSTHGALLRILDKYDGTVNEMHFLSEQIAFRYASLSASGL